MFAASKPHRSGTGPAGAKFGFRGELHTQTVLQSYGVVDLGVVPQTKKAMFSVILFFTEREHTSQDRPAAPRKSCRVRRLKDTLSHLSRVDRHVAGDVKRWDDPFEVPVSVREELNTAWGGS